MFSEVYHWLTAIRMNNFFSCYGNFKTNIMFLNDSSFLSSIKIIQAGFLPLLFLLNLICVFFLFVLVRADNLSNSERGGVGIYLKEIFAARPVHINSLKGCLLLKVFTGNKKGFILSIYRF